MSWSDHLPQASGICRLYLLSQRNINRTSFLFQNCLHLDSRFMVFLKPFFKESIFFKEIFVIFLAIFKNSDFFFLLLDSGRLVEYNYFWTKTLSLLTFTKRELTSIKNEVYDNFQNWTSLKGELFLQIKSISETALTGL